MEIQITGKNGSLTQYRITDSADQIEQIKNINYGYRNTVDGSDIIGQGSKSDIRALKTWVESQATTQTGGKSERYIVALNVAESDNLNHGESWTCTEYHIETQGVNPAFEGEQICYVYS